MLALANLVALASLLSLLVELFFEGFHLLIQFLLHLLHRLSTHFALAFPALLGGIVARARVLALATPFFLHVLPHLILHLVEALGKHKGKVVERGHAILHWAGRLRVAVVAVERLVHIKQSVEGEGYIAVHLSHIARDCRCHLHLPARYSLQRILHHAEVLAHAVLPSNDFLVFGVLYLHRVHVGD